jgi:hypothetical protein
MVIAWTSLFHAMFLRKRIKPFYRKKGSTRYEKIDGEPKRWELSECLQQHFKGNNDAARKNLEFFIGLRHKIEHCSLAQLDPELFGECQAMLLNFENMIVSEFGDRYAIRGGLSFTLQFAKALPKSPSSALTKSRQNESKRVKQYVDTFRSSLSTEVQSDLAYSFKVYLVPKVGSHASKDTVAVEFVKYDASKPEEMKQYEQLVALIKPKEVSVANLGLLKASDVVAQVAKKLRKKFTVHTHTLCYKHFNIRPTGKATDPQACDTRYCCYDALHKDYCYQPAWVDHLVNKLSDDVLYQAVVQKQVAQAIPAVAEKLARG